MTKQEFDPSMYEPEDDPTLNDPKPQECPPIEIRQEMVEAFIEGRDVNCDVEALFRMGRWEHTNVEVWDKHNHKLFNLNLTSSEIEGHVSPRLKISLYKKDWTI